MGESRDPRSDVAGPTAALDRFWAECHLAPDGTTALDRRLRAPGSWSDDWRPPDNDDIDLLEWQSRVDPAAWLQITRVDAATGLDEVTLTKLPDDSIEVAEARWEWSGAHTGRPVRRAGTALVIPRDEENRTSQVVAAIVDLRTRRRRGWKRCAACDAITAPEHRHRADLCQGCAESRLGVIH